MLMFVRPQGPLVFCAGPSSPVAEGRIACLVAGPIVPSDGDGSWGQPGQWPVSASFLPIFHGCFAYTSQVHIVHDHPPKGWLSLEVLLA